MTLKLKPKQFSSVIWILACAFLSALLVLYSPLALEGARNGLALCGQVIIPSMYPFLVLAGIFTQLQPGVKRFPAPLGAVLLGFLGGYPLGARTAAQLLEQGAVTRAQAQRLQLFCVNAGPAYLIGAVGAGLLGSRRAGMLLFASMLLAGLALGLLTKFLPEQSIGAACQPPATASPPERKPFDHILLTAVTQATGSILGVCAWIVLFSALCALLQLLPQSLWPAIPTLNVLLEVSSGAAAVVRASMPLPVLCAALGWGGLGVHCQLLGDIRKTGLPLRLFWVSRILHGALAAAICAALVRWFPVELPAAAMWGAGRTVRLWAVSAPAAAALLFFCAFLILDLDLNRKVC
ncbi:MAG: hypothetical protein FWC27_14920 [Firmicutes bacterium]|nr:hypothetical protein [Bacillota bacterium]